MAGSSRGLELVAPRAHPTGSADSAPARLIRRCRDGDESAWAELVSRYERLVYGVALREGLTAEDAADATQAVFEALLIALPSLREDDRLSAWLYAVARRQAWRLRDRRRREWPAGTIDADEPSADFSISDPATELDRSLALHDALQELGDPCRTLLTALYFDPTGPSYADVAARLGRPVGSIGPSRARCLEHLRAVMRAGGWR